MALYTSPPRSAASSVVRMSSSAAAGGGGGGGASGSGSGRSWNQHFILEENVDYGMMQSLLPAAAGADVPAGIIDDGERTTGWSWVPGQAGVLSAKGRECISLRCGLGTDATW